MAFNSALYSTLGYDPLKDFVPVALVYRFGYVMVGRKDLPQARLQDIVAAAKASPGSITVATAGVLYTYAPAATGTPPPTFGATGMPAWLSISGAGVLTAPPSLSVSRRAR